MISKINVHYLLKRTSQTDKNGQDVIRMNIYACIKIYYFLIFLIAKRTSQRMKNGQDVIIQMGRDTICSG